jgi:polysaccharide deacetylase family protein (PEP-CTERM system associated)
MFKNIGAPTSLSNVHAITVNAMTIDVEDYFQVSAFKNNIQPTDWDRYECRVEANVDLILQLLDKHNQKATFFTLGWIAKRYPQIVRKIVASNHEIASHGYGHQMIDDLTKEEFREDIIRAKSLLEDIGGVEIEGYRAPSFSINTNTLWAHDVLASTNHKYSSSVYPIKHDLYGIPDAPRFAYILDNGLVEIPATSIRLAQRNFPASGGGFFRLFPLSLSKAIIRRINAEDQQPAMFYCHPWEFDPEQPRIADASAKSKFRHYVNLRLNTEKFDSLLSSFSWAPMKEVFSSLLVKTNSTETIK